MRKRDDFLKREYICSLCGESVYLDSEEAYGNDNILCDNCNKKNTLKTTSAVENSSIGHISTRVIGSGVKMLVDGVMQSGIVDDFKGLLNLGNEMLIKKGSNRIAEGFKSDKDELNFSNWICIGNLYEAHLNGKLRKYNNCIGLYMHKIDNKIMYIGRAIEYNNGGFRKRLADYCRDSSSARKHTSGQIIYQHRKEITTYLLIVGDDEQAKQETIRLEKAYINKYNPPWNKQLKTN